MTPVLTAEAVSFSASLPVRVERVRRAPRAPAPDRFVHFHAAAEIVLFEEVRGVMLTDADRFDLVSGCATWSPSMSAHDFALERGAAAWTLIQFYQNFAQVRPPGGAACLTFAAVDRRRLRRLSDWLCEAVEGGRAQEAQRYLDLILLTFDRARRRQGASVAPTHALARFRPLLERLREAPAAKLSLTDAASLCRLSPAYFSRLFRDVFGRGFSDYLMHMRLDHAAIALAGDREPVSSIGYRSGFTSHAYFSAQFRKRFGCTPSEFRRQASQR